MRECVRALDGLANRSAWIHGTPFGVKSAGHGFRQQRGGLTLVACFDV